MVRRRVNVITIKNCPPKLTKYFFMNLWILRFVSRLGWIRISVRISNMCVALFLSIVLLLFLRPGCTPYFHHLCCEWYGGWRADSARVWWCTLDWIIIKPSLNTRWIISFDCLRKFKTRSQYFATSRLIIINSRNSSTSYTRQWVGPIEM